jgi:hypothetical protein
MSAERMRCLVVVATARADGSETIEGIASTAAVARQFACQVAASQPQKVVRCWVKEVDWTEEQVQGLWCAWGRRDARAGLPPNPFLPPEYAAAYRRGFGAACGLSLLRPPTT